MTTQPPIIQLDSYLDFGDITKLAKHFGCSRVTVYKHLRHNNPPKRKRGVPNNEIRAFAINMVRSNIEQMRQKANELEKTLPALV